MKSLNKILRAALLLSMLPLLFFYPSSAQEDCKTTQVVEKNGDVVWYFECEVISDNPTQTPEPTDTPVEPSPYPSPTQTFPSPEPSVLPSVTPQPTIIVPSESTPPVIEPTPTMIITQDVKYVTLENGVKLNEEQAVAVALLQNPAELLKKVFVNPSAALKALGNVGADLPPKKRKKAQQVTFPVVIVGSIVANTSSILARGRMK